MQKDTANWSKRKIVFKYNMIRQRTDEYYYNSIAGKFSSVADSVRHFGYDEKGFTVLDVTSDGEGKIISKKNYLHEYDKFGNLVKTIVFLDGIPFAICIAEIKYR